MAKFSNFERIVVYQPRNAWVCDLGPGSALSPRFDPQEEYFRTGAGTREPIERFRQLVIPIFDDLKLTHLRTMQIEGCEIRAILIGGGSNIVWEYNSAVNLVSFPGDPGAVTGANLILNTDIFECSVYQNKDLIAGIPWDCQDAAAESATYYLPGPTGFAGNRWEVPSNGSVDENGTYTGSNYPVLEMYCPLEGAALQLAGGWTGQCETLDWSGATLSTTNKTTNGSEPTFTVDAGTWKIKLQVSTAASRPRLYVSNSGALASDRVGGCIDCSDLAAELGSAPGWSS